MKPSRYFFVAVILWAILLGSDPPREVQCGRGESPRRGAKAGRFTEPRPWPVDVPIHLSSSFGEFRDGHLHAGVDIRSFGREGIPCRAVASGQVARLRASPFGYGMAVYLALETGETAVYAHLSEFAPAIDSVVYAAQLESDRYEVDIHLEPGRFPVRQGEIIGYTGRTGAAAPHLHFEVRDSAEHPVNPLDVGWTLKDTLPPTILGVECLPLGPDSRVDGRCAPKVVPVHRVAAGAFAARETVAVCGRIGFAVQVTDRLDPHSGRLAPHGVEFEVDGERLSLIEMKRFSYEHTREVELAYDMGRARTRGEHYLLLFGREGETLWDREFRDGGVVVTDSLPPRGGPDGVHAAVVRAMDRAGWITTATVHFVVSESRAASGADASPGETRTPRAEGHGEFQGCYFFEDMMSVQGFAIAEARPINTAATSASGGDALGGDTGELVLSFDGVGETGRTIPLRVEGRTSDVHVVAARSDATLVCNVDEIGVGLAVKKGSLYSNTLLYLAAWGVGVAGTVPAGSGMAPVTPGARFGPMSAALKNPVEIRFRVASPLEGNEAVYRFDERRTAWSISPSSIRGDTVCSFVREPGVYAVLADSLAPAIGAPRVSIRQSYATGSLLREIVVAVTDRGSGVDAGRTEVYLDGRKQVARWDGFSEKTIVLLRDENIIGMHDLSVVAADRAGNSSELVTHLDIPPPAVRGGKKGPR